MRSGMFRVTVCLAMLALMAPLLQAQTILYDNGAPNGLSGGYVTAFTEADDFTLDHPAVVTGVRFWDAEVRGADAFQGSILWTIYGDNGANHCPGPIVARGQDTPAHTYTGYTIAPWDGYQNDLTLPGVRLDSGTYWLGLHNGPLSSSSPDHMAWVVDFKVYDNSCAQQPPFDSGNWMHAGFEFAFNVSGTVLPASVPEPGPISSLVAVVACAWLLRLLRRVRA